MAMFSAVYACGSGNWEGEGRFKMWFNHGGAIEFGQAMLHAGQLGEFLSGQFSLSIFFHTGIPHTMFPHSWVFHK